jgi:hypothetical protein
MREVGGSEESSTSDRKPTEVGDVDSAAKPH